MEAMDGPMVGRPVIEPKRRSKAMKTTVALRNISLIALLGAALAAPVFAQPGPGGRAMRFDQNNTRGWTLMTPEERTAHREKMLSLKTYEECKAFQADHRHPGWQQVAYFLNQLEEIVGTVDFIHFAGA